MTPKVIRRCLALATLAVAGLTLAGCSSTTGGARPTKETSPKFQNKGLLYVDHNLFGTKKISAYPDPIVIPDYGTNPNQLITWIYINDETQIVFDEPKIGKADCDQKAGTCTVKLPGGLFDGLPDSQRKRLLKYTIKGKHTGDDIHDHDPEVEIDR